MRLVHICLCTFFISFSAFSQKESTDIEFSSQVIALNDLLEEIEFKTGYFFSYNSSIIQANQIVDLGVDRNLTLTQALRKIENQLVFDIEIDKSETRKILISQSKSKTISGRVIDALSFESIIGATIYSTSNTATISNVNGYFKLMIPRSDSIIVIQNMGYDQSTITVTKKYTENLEISLNANLDLNIIITPDPNIKVKQDYKIDIGEISDNSAIGGTPDVFGFMKTLPGVSTGSEGQNGIMVRGGGPHQNLILIDGIPIYESSHLGGLSSIFLPEAISNMSFYKSGFPARYGGKLSGVLDVSLKEGDKKEFRRSLSLSLEGLVAHIDGPIGKNTSINLNGKLSWFSRIISPVVKANTDIKDLNLKYNDTYLKITHRLSPKNKLSISAYLGEDLVLLRRQASGPNQFEDYNRINWGNKMASLNWSSIVSDNLFLNMNIGVSNYNYRSRGTYELNFISNGLIENKSYDILSISNIQDIILSPQIEYYSSKLGKLTFGANYIKHRNEPSIIESEIFTPDESTPTSIDTSYVTDELAVYIEHKLRISKFAALHSGLRGTAYFNENKQYMFIQPRLSLEVKKENTLIQLSYGKMSQFTHLLSNPGLGLPSDLWVPSTNLVPPEVSHNFSFDYKVYNKAYNYGFSLFYKTFENLIEYSNATDILYSFVLNTELFQLEIDNQNWEERVSIGKGRSYGLELFSKFQFSKFNIDFAYTLSKSERQFNSIDKGESFPYKFDRPHDFSTKLVYNFDANKRLKVNWTYGTGNAYTLSDLSQLGPNDTPILIESSRNNRRLQDFHHLDISYEFLKRLKNNSAFKVNLGIYNIYNRLNPFYEYLLEGGDSDPELVKISLYPILPQVNVTWSW